MVLYIFMNSVNINMCICNTHMCIYVTYIYKCTYSMYYIYSRFHRHFLYYNSCVLSFIRREFYLQRYVMYIKHTCLKKQLNLYIIHIRIYTTSIYYFGVLVINLLVLGCWFIIFKSNYFYIHIIWQIIVHKTQPDECKEIMNSYVIMSVSIYKMHKLIICWSSLTCISCQAVVIGSHL